jgi:phage gp37-like protein
MHEFEQLEDTVITALEPLKAQGLRTLETYTGQVEVDELEEITVRFPCIYVMVADLKLNVKNRSDIIEMGVRLIVGDRNLRGSGAAARGDATSPGVYDLLKAARDALHRKHLLNGWTPLILASEAPIIYAPKLSICLYEATYEMKTIR